MARLFTVVLVLLLVDFIATDANRARRLRRHQTGGSNSVSNAAGSQPEARQQPLGSGPQILNAQGQFGQQQFGQSGLGANRDGNQLGSAQGSRQYYPYQGQYPQGMGQGSNLPYGSGMGSGFQSGMGQYGQYGQGMGMYGQGMGQNNPYGQYGQNMGQYGGAYYNQNPGSGSFYSGYGSGSSYNRPGYSQYGSSGYGFWNAAQKQNVNLFTVLFSSFVALFLCFITM